MAENYIICGGDPYLREKEEKKIRDKFLSPGELDLNYSVYGPEDAENIMDPLETLPFLADKRVVMVKIAQELPAAVLGSLEKYLERPTETSVLVLSCDEPFGKKAAFRVLSKKMTVINIAKLTPQKTLAGIYSFFKKENIEISPEAAELILELKGTDPGLIRPELEKLAGYSGGKRIEAADVEELVGRSVTETIFKLVEAINSKNTGLALRILADAGDPRKEGPKMLGYLAGHVKAIQKVRVLAARGADMNEMVSALGKRAYFIKPQAGKFPPEKISKWIKCLLEADLDIKKGRKSPSLALETLFAKLAGT